MLLSQIQLAQTDASDAKLLSANDDEDEDDAMDGRSAQKVS